MTPPGFACLILLCNAPKILLKKSQKKNGGVRNGNFWASLEMSDQIRLAKETVIKDEIQAATEKAMAKSSSTESTGPTSNWFVYY